MMRKSLCGIVYIDGFYTFTPYYAPNGLPYRYNPETDNLEEIDYSIPNTEEIIE